MDWGSYWPHHPLARLSPDEIAVRVAELTRCYQVRPQAGLARRISLHFRTLCLHPDHQATASQRCAWYHLALYWQCLALRHERRSP